MISYKLKILLCGPAGSGKTDLMMKIVQRRFQTDYKLTVGVDILTKDVVYDDINTATLSIWDIGGQERFSFIRSTFYRGAAGTILVFDPNDTKQWEAVKNWRSEVKQYSGNIPFILIANNTQNLEVANRSEFKNYAESENGLYYEVKSYKLDEIQEYLVDLVNKIIS
jgi:small GTP-binding protein